MNFSDILKKILRNSEVKEKIKPKEKLTFSNIKELIKNKSDEIESREKELLVSIKANISTEIKNIEIKLEILENFDFQKRKDKEKIEAIVKENWKNYIFQLKKFINNLSEIQESDFEKFITKTDIIFTEFHKKSYLSYEKATILIGKEMANIRDNIIILSKHLKEMFEQNKDIIKSSKAISLIKLNLKQLDEFDQNLSKISEKITILDRETINLEEKKKRLLKEIEKIKKSMDYLDYLNKKEKIKAEKEELEKEIYNLKEKIDFKGLENKFHDSKKKMDIIQRYKENFQKSFLEDNCEGILELFVEAEHNVKDILDKVNQINNKKEEINKNELLVKKDQTEPLFIEIQKISLEIGNLQNEKEKDLKNQEKLKQKKIQEINLIKQGLNELNIFVSND